MKKLTIGSTCNVLNGYSFKSNQYVDEGIRIIRIANVQKGYVEDNSPVFYPLDSEGLDNYMLKEDDLLISLTGNVGRVALLSGDMLPAALNQRVACLRLKDNSIYKRFLFHYLNSTSFENKCILESKGIAQKNMSTEWLKKQELPILNYNTQIKVSETLDSIIEIINIKKRQLQEYDQLIKSRFVEMFGDPIKNDKRWKTDKLNTVCPINKYKGQVENNEGKVWLLNLDMIESNTGKIINYVFENESDIANSTIKFNDNCVLYSKLRPYLNKVVVPVKSGYATSEIISMQTERISKYFLFNLLRMKSFVDFANGTAYGAKMPRASVDRIKNFDLILPPVDLQDEFEKFVIQVDKLKFEVQKSLDESQTLFDSLMQEYFG